LKAKAADSKEYSIKITDIDTEEKDTWKDGDKITIAGKAIIVEKKMEKMLMEPRKKM